MGETFCVEPESRNSDLKPSACVPFRLNSVICSTDAAVFTLYGSLTEIIGWMFPKPTEDDKQTVVEYVKSFSTPLVPSESLYSSLEDEGMNHDLVTWCLTELEAEDRIWMLHVPEDNQHGLPSGEFTYIPYDGMDEPLRL